MSILFLGLILKHELMFYMPVIGYEIGARLISRHPFNPMRPYSKHDSTIYTIFTMLIFLSKIWTEKDLWQDLALLHEFSFEPQGRDRLNLQNNSMLVSSLPLLHYKEASIHKTKTLRNRKVEARTCKVTDCD